MPPVSRDLDIEVPFGARVPAVFLDDTPRPAPQQAALERIMDEFQDTIQRFKSRSRSSSVNLENPAADGGNFEELQVWEKARQQADRRYQILYGDAAYNRLTMLAAMQALEERREAAKK